MTGWGLSIKGFRLVALRSLLGSSARLATLRCTLGACTRLSLSLLATLRSALLSSLLSVARLGLTLLPSATMSLFEELLQLTGGEDGLEFVHVGQLHIDACLLSGEPGLDLLDDLGVRGSGLFLRLFSVGLLCFVALLATFLVACRAGLVQRLLVFVVEGGEFGCRGFVQHQPLSQLLCTVLFAPGLWLLLRATGLRTCLGLSLGSACSNGGLRLLRLLFGLLGHHGAGDCQDGDGGEDDFFHVSVGYWLVDCDYTLLTAGATSGLAARPFPVADYNKF